MELKVGEIIVPEKIAWNYEELKKELTEKVGYYETVVYNDEQIKQAKADRATLNKLKSALKDERLRREREYMKPFIEFKAQIEEIVAIIDKPIAAIDKQIKAFEEQEQAEKRNKIIELFDSLQQKPEWLKIEQIWDPRWLNKSVTFRMIEDNMLGWFGRIDTELATISKLATGAFEAGEAYKRTLNLGEAIAEGQRMAEVAAAKEASQGAPLPWDDMPAPFEPAVEAQATPPAANDEDNPKMWVAFEAYINFDEALALKAFFDARGIEFRKVDVKEEK